MKFCKISEIRAAQNYQNLVYLEKIMLKNDYLVTAIGVETAENEPFKSQRVLVGKSRERLPSKVGPTAG